MSLSVSVAVRAAPTFVPAALFSATLREAVGDENTGGALVVPTALVTVVAATARLPLPAASSTASALSATVTGHPAWMVRLGDSSVSVTVLPERLTVAPCS